MCLLLLFIVFVIACNSQTTIVTDFYGGLSGNEHGESYDQGRIFSISWSICHWDENGGLYVGNINWDSDNKTYDGGKIGRCTEGYTTISCLPSSFTFENGEYINSYRVQYLYGDNDGSGYICGLHFNSSYNNSFHCGPHPDQTYEFDTGWIQYNGYYLSGFQWKSGVVCDGIGFQFTTMPTISPTISPTMLPTTPSNAPSFAPSFRSQTIVTDSLQSLYIAIIVVIAITIIIIFIVIKKRHNNVFVAPINNNHNNNNNGSILSLQSMETYQTMSSHNYGNIIDTMGENKPDQNNYFVGQKVLIEVEKILQVEATIININIIDNDTWIVVKYDNYHKGVEKININNDNHRIKTINNYNESEYEEKMDVVSSKSIDTQIIDAFDECVFCMDNIAEYVCIPCGHLCLCKQCKVLINSKCPVCLSKLLYPKFMKLYK